jgi:hypothetical protein
MQPSPAFRPTQTQDKCDAHTLPPTSDTHESAADNKALISVLRQDTMAVVRTYVLPTKRNA